MEVLVVVQCDMSISVVCMTYISFIQADMSPRRESEVARMSVRWTTAELSKYNRSTSE